MSYNTVQLAYDGGVATITLSRPEKRNAISFELIDDLLRPCWGARPNRI
jgi:enoyl-CoA hydratase/carnithine racemase